MNVPHVSIRLDTACLQGYLIGNGVTDDVFDGNAYLPFAAGKSLISELQLQRAKEACNGNFWDVKLGSRCVARLLADWRATQWLGLGDVMLTIMVLDTCAVHIS